MAPGPALAVRAPRGARSPACLGADPVRELVADLEAGGPQTVLASLRYGVVLLSSSSGAPLASLELGCSPPADGGSQVMALAAARLTGLSPLDLVVRTLQTGHCGRLGQWLLLR